MVLSVSRSICLDEQGHEACMASVEGCDSGVGRGGASEG